MGYFSQLVMLTFTPCQSNHFSVHNVSKTKTRRHFPCAFTNYMYIRGIPPCKTSRYNLSIYSTEYYSFIASTNLAFCCLDTSRGDTCRQNMGIVAIIVISDTAVLAKAVKSSGRNWLQFYNQLSDLLSKLLINNQIKNFTAKHQKIKYL